MRDELDSESADLEDIDLELDEALQDILAVPEEQLLALGELIEKLGGVDRAQEVLSALRDRPQAA